MGMKEKMHTGELYLPGDKEIVEIQTKCLDMLYEFNQTRPTEIDKRNELLQKMIAVGNPCKVLREVNEHDYEYYFKDRKINSLGLTLPD
jgi:hypothetical protein